jgi:hypothetical protein
VTGWLIAMVVEFLLFDPVSSRGSTMFEALTDTAQGHTCVTTRAYSGTSDLLMLWGPGAPNRFHAMRAHLDRGKHLVAWDLAYWQRDNKVRCSIDGAHPSAWVMRREWPQDRLLHDGVSVYDRWQPDGPILVAGLGQKARVQYGASIVDAWEASMIAACRARYSNRVLYRSKNGGAVPAGVDRAQSGQIDDALSGASLVVTWHSNVAVDAMRLGIPVICRDGAAAAVYPSELPSTGRPAPLDHGLRAKFLANLAWFQWAPDEAETCWGFLNGLLTS